MVEMTAGERERRERRHHSPGSVSEDLPDEGAWFRVERDDTAGPVRRAAARLARQLGLPEERAADSAIVVAEVSSNLVKHADEGMLLVRPVRHERTAGIELIAVDTGPGMADARGSSRDGHSTAGTLGIGLGAIGRLASWSDIYSYPGRGTVLVAQVWPADPPAPARVAGVTRPLAGERTCGDAYAERVVDGRLQVLVCDGLGHGPLAAAAAQAAVHAFAAAPPGSPAVVVEHLHRALRPTRGAALAVAQLHADSVRYCGLGNIAGSVVDGTVRQGMVSMPGIAGHHCRQLREFAYPLRAGAVVVLHSDGLTDRWQPGDYPGLFGHAPQVIAASVLRDAGVRRDDACVLAARMSP
jgi:anti-sigma regulatory factor (Ser/Thr protein kinase)